MSRANIVPWYNWQCEKALVWYTGFLEDRYVIFPTRPMIVYLTQDSTNWVDYRFRGVGLDIRYFCFIIFFLRFTLFYVYLRERSGRTRTSVQLNNLCQQNINFNESSTATDIHIRGKKKIITYTSSYYNWSFWILAQHDRGPGGLSPVFRIFPTFFFFFSFVY